MIMMARHLAVMMTLNKAIMMIMLMVMIVMMTINCDDDANDNFDVPSHVQ